MSDSESDDPPKSNQPITLSAEQFAEFMRISMSQKHSNHQPPSLESLGEVRLTEKLNGDNYPLWVKLMRRAIWGKGLASHINGVTDPPPPTDPDYNRWQQRDDCCFNWIINNIDASLVNEVSQYETAYDLWESLATTYGSGADQFQISDLHRQTYSLKQGNLSLENLWQKFQDLWISIDTRDPNPMDTPSSIEKYNQHTQRHRLYQFLWALDDNRYDKIKREILNMDPIPTARKAYGLVRRESVNEKLLNPEPKESGIGVGLAAFDRNRTQNYQQTPNCFHIHGFPEWWEEMKKNRQLRSTNRNSGGGRASAAVAVDRATYTDKPAGGVGPSATGGGENRTEEKSAIASVSMARVWSEGKRLVTEATGKGEIAAAKVPTAARVRRQEETGAARVSEFGGVFNLKTSKSRKSKFDPGKLPKSQTDPQTPYYSHLPPQN
ncbi:uncharacterized protein LOC125199900 [Salvia hispanica]|uniref:uncharacterized protein LOC125199900 n=1 Tax=Salvia hispanica TaxID=49212 RepID=UPI0020095E4D|nr:uncharacterized protein LOC125199900 [Salvia hispanica]